MNAAPFPAGWYRDPSARHEQRYWDGFRWGPQVLDRGYASDDPSGAVPAADSLAWDASRARMGYRAVHVGSWRVAVLMVAGAMSTLALLFEIWASVMVFGAKSTADGDWLFLWTWLYHERSSSFGLTYIGYPPIAIFVVLFLALAFLSGVTIPQESALKKAGAQGARFWSPAPERETWSVSVARLRAQTGVRFLNTLMRPHHRIFLVLEVLAGLAIIGVSLLAIQGRAALDVSGQAISAVTLSVGLGPWICLTAGAACVLAAVIAWPLRPRKILIRWDGTVEPLT